MGASVYWDFVENSCAENRELAKVIRELEGLHRGDAPIDWSGSRERRAEALTAWLDSSAQSQELAKRLDGVEYEIGGDEHHIVRVDACPDRIYKITHGDAFGCYSMFLPSDPDLTGRHFYGTINEDPNFYLRRWMLLNSLGGYRTRFEGFLPAQERLRMPRICVSQPSLDSINPTRREISDSLAVYGFAKVSEDAFWHKGTNILLTDSAPRNVRIVEGIPVPFDAIAMLASSRILEWLSERR